MEDVHFLYSVIPEELGNMVSALVQTTKVFLVESLRGRNIVKKLKNIGWKL